MTASILLTFVSALSFYLASARTSDDMWSRWLIAPVAGASLACAIAILFSREREPSRIISGRIITAIVFAIGIPRYLGWQWPELMTWVQDVILLTGAGLVWGLLGYFMGKPIVERISRDAPKVADRYTSDALRKINAGKKRRSGDNRHQRFHHLAQEDEEETKE